MRPHPSLVLAPEPLTQDQWRWEWAEVGPSSWSGAPTLPWAPCPGALCSRRPFHATGPPLHAAGLALQLRWSLGPRRPSGSSQHSPASDGVRCGTSHSRSEGCLQCCLSRLRTSFCFDTRVDLSTWMGPVGLPPASRSTSEKPGRAVLCRRAPPALPSVAEMCLPLESKLRDQ